MAQRIEIVRGTSNTFQVFVTDPTGLPYNLGSGEKLVFGIKKEKEDETPIFQITAEIIGEGMFNVVLAPEHTENLDGGKYWYDVAVDDGTKFYNVIKANEFKIIPNITKRGAV